jgi:hypothetical protein
MIIGFNDCLTQLCTSWWRASEAPKYLAVVFYYCDSNEIFAFFGLQWSKSYHIYYCFNSIFCGNKLKLLTSLVHILYNIVYSQSQWPRGLRRGSTAARLLGLCVRIPPGAWMFVSCVCCVLSGRGLWIGLITRPEESYRVWFIQWVWSRSPVRGGHEPELGRSATGEKIVILIKSYSISANTNYRSNSKYSNR